MHDHDLSFRGDKSRLPNAAVCSIICSSTNAPKPDPWPQFFDGKATQTQYAVRYNVQPIPHVLLAGPGTTVP
ncbi:MAG: hypothetical protein CK548_06735 [Opitutia bacterium]|nr:hypothetical protein [Opitutaceae bacterium]PHX71440.1 MAG: hypothetical protein CK548_06735 [Opitutae bacterium]